MTVGNPESEARLDALAAPAPPYSPTSEVTLPSLLVYELANILRYKADLSTEQVQTALASLFDMDLTWVLPSSAMMERAVELARGSTRPTSRSSVSPVPGGCRRRDDIGLSHRRLPLWQGNHRTAKRMPLYHKFLEFAGIEPERFYTQWVSASEGGLFTQVVTESTETLREMPPMKERLQSTIQTD